MVERKPWVSSMVRLMTAPSGACEDCARLVDEIAAWNAAHAPTSSLSFDTFADVHPSLERVDELPSGQEGPVELWVCRHCETDWWCMLWFEVGYLDVSRYMNTDGSRVCALERIVEGVRCRIPVTVVELDGHWSLRTPTFEVLVETRSRPPYRIRLGSRTVEARSSADAANSVVALIRDARRKA